MNLNIPRSKQPRIVIVGGGFAGLTLARQLRDKAVQVVLIDQNNYHTFQPLLYQVATGGLEPDSIAYPFRKVLQDSRNVHFRMAEVEEVRAEIKCLKTNAGLLAYDYLVIATGSQSNFFGFTPQKEQMMPLKTIPNALDLRSFVLQNFEMAAATEDPFRQSALINIVIVGGGPTGLELAGALAEMKKYVFPKDYPDFDLSGMRIILFEAADRLLSAMSEHAAEKAKQYLKQMGVEVYLNALVEHYDGHIVSVSDGQKVRTATLIWTAGVKGKFPKGLHASEIERGNRIKVNTHNQVVGYKDIYAIGDVAAMPTDGYPQGHPMLAPVAIQQAKLLAKNFLRIQSGKALQDFKYFDKGAMATIGRNKAVVDVAGWKFQGFFAWLIWMFVHVVSLIGFRNKLATLWNWMHNYFTYDRAIRLIIRPFHRVPRPSQQDK